MRITAPGDLDLDVRAGATAADVWEAAGMDRAWCGPIALDPDHPAGMAPLVHGARLTTSPAPSCVPPTGPHLHVAEGPDAGHTVPLVGPVLIGRSPEADLCLADPAVSAEHAMVSGSERIRVRDLRSANGTGSPRLRRLRPGDHLVVGRSRIVLVAPAADARASTDTTADPPRGTDTARRWGMLAGGLASGAALAAMTGRWQLAFVGLLPAAAPWLAQALARRRDTGRDDPAEISGPVAVRGDDEAVRGYVRALLVDRGRGPVEEEWREPWTRWLEAPDPHERIVRIPPGAAWPSWCPTKVDVTLTSRVEESTSGCRTLLPLAISAATADVLARRRASSRADDSLPRELTSADFVGPGITPGAHDSSGPRRLRVAIGATAEGPLVLDLDADGPHFLIAGTTGSGKSVALETFVTALAHAHPPKDLTLALVDFKGGAGLRGCMGLPHVAATLTDLDGALARRALAGLSHELATRKAALSERGLASLSEWEEAGGAPPRLVVVIDEYQEIVSAHATFLPDLARIAAQGRSLGLHLVLATQRPAGAVTPEVRANVATTIALRVASASESRDLLGTPAAAAISASLPGRAIVARGSRHLETQIAAPSADPTPAVTRADAPRARGTHAAHAAIERWRDHPQAEPLWRPPLPRRWAPSSPPTDGVAIARVDRPVLRVQTDVAWNPHEGAAVVIGTGRSGRTSVLRSIAHQSRELGLTPVFLPTDPRLASRTLALAAEHPETLLLIDDVDAALSRLATVDDGAAVEDLTRRAALRLPTAMAGGPATPVRLATSAAVLTIGTAVDSTVAAQWGVPRVLTEHAAEPAPGRAHVRHQGDWDLGQLAALDDAATTELVRELPRRVDAAPTGNTVAAGGDDASAVHAPTGPVTIVGPPGRTHDAARAWLSTSDVTAVDLPALVRPGTETVVLVEPTARAIRQLAPHAWRGLADPHPVPGRVVLIRHGSAMAVQLPVC